MSGAVVQIGIAGWSYADWQGIVYPQGCADPLKFCAGLVPVMEINNTFYRVPEAKYSASWVQRTQDSGLRFWAKLPREFSHQGRRDAALVERTRRGLEPLRAAGRLDGLLAQFHHSFVANADNFERLRVLRDAFVDFAPLCVELRHRSWQEQNFLSGLRDLDVSVANLDYPGGAQGFDLACTQLNGSADVAYLRLHGRNHEAWWDRDAGRDQVYDYEYSKGELEGIQQRITQLREQAAKVVVVANNHFQGKAMKLALQLIAWQLQERVAVPEGLLARYPDLDAVAEKRQGRLF